MSLTLTLTAICVASLCLLISMWIKRALDKGNPNDKRVSGKYEVDFGALHLAGQFVAKYQKDKNWICE
jgi:hypothetical protein